MDQMTMKDVLLVVNYHLECQAGNVQEEIQNQEVTAYKQMFAETAKLQDLKIVMMAQTMAKDVFQVALTILLAGFALQALQPHPQIAHEWSAEMEQSKAKKNVMTETKFFMTDVLTA